MDFAEAIRSHPTALDLLGRLDENPCPDMPVLTAKVKLLWNCNLSCTFCSLPDSRAILSRETALALGRDLAAHGLRKVHFSGGEVLLHPEIFQILEDWSNLGIQVNLTSNGTLMGKDEVRRMEEAGVHSISLSIDSAKRKTHDSLRGREGAFRAVTRAAERIVARGRIRLRINTVVTSFNIRELAGMRELVRELGARASWKLIPVDPKDPSVLPRKKHVEALASEIRHWEELEDRHPFGNNRVHYRETAEGHHGFRETPCHVPWFHLFFTPEGDSYPCCMAERKTPSLGNFPERSISEILKGEPLCSLRKRMVAGERMGACQRCDDFLSERNIIADMLAERTSD